MASLLSVFARAITLVTSRWPVVSVPVLSKTTLVTLLSRERVSGFLITIPCLAHSDVATTRLIGTAIPKAHGQAITRTAIAADNPCPASWRAIAHTK